MRKRLARILLPALLIASALQAAAQTDDLGRPAAIDRLASGSLYALDEQGSVHAVDFPGGKPAVTGSFRLPVGGAESDIVCAQLGGKDVLFVAANFGLIGQVSIFSTTGQMSKQYWNLPNGVAGIAYDAADSILYVASGRTPEIFGINVLKNGSPVFLAETPGSQRLGPILYDVRENALLVGDLVMGAIYKVDIVSRKAALLFGGLTSPSGMKLSADGSLLFVSDDAARRVVTFTMAQPGSAPKVFAKIPQFRSPSGLAWVDEGLAVSDDGARKLFILSKSGALLAMLPAAH
jgi:DNA-binding beta-propeller fold protein YncE